MAATVTPFKIMLAGTATMVLLIFIIAQRIPVPADPIVLAAAAEQDQFDEAWIDIMRPLALKTAALERDAYTPLSTDSKPVDDARIVSPAPDDAPASMPPVLLVQDEDKPLASRHRRQRASNEPNLCARHRMRKVAVHGGKSWRCRRL